MERRIVKSEPDMRRSLHSVFSLLPSRHHHHHLRFHLYLDTVCHHFLRLGRSGQRLRHSTLGDLPVRLLRQVVGDMDSITVYQHVHTLPVQLRQHCGVEESAGVHANGA